MSASVDRLVNTAGKHLPDPVGEATALGRLASSRVRIRGALQDIAHPPPRRALFAGQTGIVHRLESLLRVVPGASYVIDAVTSWWAAHPARDLSTLASSELASAVKPIARQYPAASLATSAGLGALVVAFRPWRWLRRGFALRTLAQVAAHRTRGPQQGPLLRFVEGLITGRL